MKICIIEKTKNKHSKNTLSWFYLEPWICFYHNTIQWLNCVVHYLNIKMKGYLVDIIDLNFVVNSNEMACRKGDVLGWTTSYKITYKMNQMNHPTPSGNNCNRTLLHRQQPTHQSFKSIISTNISCIIEKSKKIHSKKTVGWFSLEP